MFSLFYSVTGGVIGPHYASSKSAMHGLIHWLSLRYAKDGIVGDTHIINISLSSLTLHHSVVTPLLLP